MSTAIHRDDIGSDILRRAVALVLLLPVSSNGCAIIGTQLARDDVRGSAVARFGVDSAPVGATTGTTSKEHREVVLRYDVQRSEPSGATWVLAALGMLADLLPMVAVATAVVLSDPNALAGAETGSNGNVGLAGLLVLGVLVIDPIALIALGIDDDWELSAEPQYLEPEPSTVVTLDVEGSKVHAPLWIEPAPDALALDLLSADGVTRVPLVEPDASPVAGSGNAPPGRRAPVRSASDALPFRLHALPTGHISCPQPAPLLRHHRVVPESRGSVRTGLALARPGEAFSVSGVRSTTDASGAAHLLFEVDSDGRSDVVLRVDVAVGCLRAHGRKGAPLAPLSVVVSDGHGKVFGGVDVDAPAAEDVRQNYGAATALVTIPRRALAAGRHTLTLHARGGLAERDVAAPQNALDQKFIEYTIVVGRLRPPTKPPERRARR